MFEAFIVPWFVISLINIDFSALAFDIVNVLLFVNLSNMVNSAVSFSRAISVFVLHSSSPKPTSEQYMLILPPATELLTKGI